MPATPMKNLAYRLALPFLAPGPGHSCTLRGEPVSGRNAYLRLIRRHHVLGSVCLLTNGTRTLCLTTCSSSPSHDPGTQPVFRVASITKMASALLMMTCVNDGLLQLDQPVTDSLPADFRHVSELQGVTLRHLLSHTSGLSDPPDLERSLELGKSVLDVLHGRRLSEPGKAFRYSNLGYGLIGCLADALFSRPFPQVFEDRVFHPLGSRAVLDASVLEESSIMPVTRILPWKPERDVTVTPLGRIPVTEPDPFHHYGHTAGSMYTDANSLMKLVQCLMHHGAPLIRPDLGREMARQHASYCAASPTLSYGLGLLRIQDPSISEGVLLGHQGFAYGCADGAFWDPATGRALIFLNGGCSEARTGRLGLCNRDLLRWAFRKEFPQWT